MMLHRHRHHQHHHEHVVECRQETSRVPSLGKRCVTRTVLAAEDIHHPMVRVVELLEGSIDLQTGEKRTHAIAHHKAPVLAGVEERMWERKVHLHEEWHGLFAARAGHICGGGHTTGHKPRLIKNKH